MTVASAPSKSSYRVPNEYAREYLSRNEGVTLSSATTETYDSHLTEYVAFLHSRDKTVLSAEFEDILSFIEACVRLGNRQNTISGKLSAIGECYRFIRLRTDVANELNLDPIRFREIDLNQYNTPSPIERSALSKKEIRRLFDSFDSYRNRLLAIVGVETGLRNSDLRNLRIKDIQDKTIHVHNPKNSKPYDVPISDQLAFEIEFWIQHHRNGYAAAKNSGYVFPSQHGKKLKHNGTLNRIIKNAAERADLQEVIGQSRISPDQQQSLNTTKEYREWHRVTAHTLRHSFITLMKDAGVELPYRMLVANHSNAETTRGYTTGSDAAFELIRDRFDPPR